VSALSSEEKETANALESNFATHTKRRRSKPQVDSNRWLRRWNMSISLQSMQRMISQVCITKSSTEEDTDIIQKLDDEEDEEVDSL
jgi:hypothetical protein